MVQATPEAEQLCAGASGLSVADLLRPHGVFKRLNSDNGGQQGCCSCHALKAGL